MKSRLLFVIAVFVFAVAPAAPSRADVASDVGLVVVSGPASPRVAYGLARDVDGLVVTVSVGSFVPDGGDASVRVGLAAERSAVLTNKDARVTRAGEADRFEFRVPAKSLVDGETAWERLRVGLAEIWAGGPLGQPRQAESFLQSAARATHGGLSADPADWQAISLAEFERAAKDRALEIASDMEQPAAGKAPVVVEDPSGRRVRNLIGGRATAQETRRVLDGRDVDGRVVPPGAYRWRGSRTPG
jgi:hypothetical protein